jgi:hypothetical protein
MLDRWGNSLVLLEAISRMSVLLSSQLCCTYRCGTLRRDWWVGSAWKTSGRGLISYHCIAMIHFSALGGALRTFVHYQNSTHHLIPFFLHLHRLTASLPAPILGTPPSLIAGLAIPYQPLHTRIPAHNAVHVSVCSCGRTCEIYTR